MATIPKRLKGDKKEKPAPKKTPASSNSGQNDKVKPYGKTKTKPYPDEKDAGKKRPYDGKTPSKPKSDEKPNPKTIGTKPSIDEKYPPKKKRPYDGKTPYEKHDDYHKKPKPKGDNDGGTYPKKPDNGPKKPPSSGGAAKQPLYKEKNKIMYASKGDKK